jgi:hypothetical protein
MSSFINMSKENSIEATHWVEMNLDGFSNELLFSARTHDIILLAR